MYNSILNSKSDDLFHTVWYQSLNHKLFIFSQFLSNIYIFFLFPYVVSLVDLIICFLAGETEEGPCVLTWEGGSGSSSSDIDPKPATSPAYTWLQTTDIHTAISPQGTIPEINKEKDQPEDIQALHDDLDQILNKLQQLLANSCAEPDPSTSPGSQQNNMMGHIMDRL